MIIGKAISAYLGNVVAFLLAAYLIPGFDLVGSITGFLLLILLVTLIHLIIRPIVKLVLSPIIILTLGLFTVVINAIILYIVDIYSQNISIDGLIALFLGTLVISFVGILVRGTSHSKQTEL